VRRTLTPANVNMSTFCKLFEIPVDGKVDAQPLYVSTDVNGNADIGNASVVVIK
jgi:hypothetical protein